METLKYRSSRSNAVRRISFVALWIILFAIQIVRSIAKGEVFYPMILGAGILLMMPHVIDLLLTDLKRKFILQINDNEIIYRNQIIAWDNVREVLLYDSGIISVVLKSKLRPRNIKDFIARPFNWVFFKGGVTIDAKGIDIKPELLVRRLNERLDLLQSRPLHAPVD